MLGNDHLRAPRVQLGEDPVDVEGLVGDQPAEGDAARSAAPRPGCRSGGPAAARSPPGCRAHRSGRRSWWSSRRASGRWPGPEFPFCALSVAVDLDDAAVDHRVLQVRIAGQRVEYAFENIGLHPVPEPLEHRVPVPEHLGQVPPRAAGARDPQHRLEEPPRIPTSAPRVGRLPRQCGSIRAHCASVNTNLVIDCSLLGA